MPVQSRTFESPLAMAMTTSSQPSQSIRGTPIASQSRIRRCKNVRNDPAGSPCLRTAAVTGPPA